MRSLGVGGGGGSMCYSELHQLFRGTDDSV